jgi:hypothetical protein
MRNNVGGPGDFQPADIYLQPEREFLDLGKAEIERGLHWCQKNRCQFEKCALAQKHAIAEFLSKTSLT